VIGLSVAVGRFLEALFWAILAAGAPLALAAVGGLAALVGAWNAVRRYRRRRR